MSHRRSLALAAPLAGLLAATAMAGSASAATTQTLGCRASVARVTALNGLLPTVEPYVANPDDAPCADDTAGATSGSVLNLGSLGAALGGTLTLGPVSADTNSVADSDDLEADSLVSVNGVSIPTLAGSISIVGPAHATAASACVNGAVQVSSGSTLTALQIGGQTISLPGPGLPDTIPLSLPGTLGLPGAVIGSVAVNQDTVTATSDTERLLDVTLNGVAQVVGGEASVTQPADNACSGLTGGGESTGSGDGTGGGGGTGGTGGGDDGGNGGGTGTGAGTVGTVGVTTEGKICPVGSSLDATTGMCEILTSAGSSTGIVIAPAGSDDITGARVISLTAARRLYGRHTACLTGTGPNYVVVGTEAANRITVAKVRMRVLGLGGKDTITVKGGNGTCVNGGAGNDTLINKQNNRVTVFGAAGNDRITLGNGSAYVLGGSGNDRIVAGNGKVDLQGNAGADYIKAGNGADTLNGGSGNDVLIAGTGKAHLNGGPGNNTMTAHGKVAFVKAGKGRSVAYVRRANMRYARRHGVARVHVL
jgi:Ca2+-binding RTX toxin-like protein